MINICCSDFDYGALKTSSAGILLLRLTFNRFTSLFVSASLHRLVPALLFLTVFFRRLVRFCCHGSCHNLFRVARAYSAKIKPLSPPGCASPLLLHLFLSTPRWVSLIGASPISRQCERERDRDRTKKRRDVGM